MKLIRSIAVFPLILAASCASKSGADKSTASAPPAQKSMNERFGGGGRDPNSYQQDSSGKFYIKEEKRSSFEGKTDANFAGKSFDKKEYKAGDYAKKSWWGNKEYDRKAYDGNTDGSRFQTTSALQGKGAREAGNAADIPDNYQTGTYATGSDPKSSANWGERGSLTQAGASTMVSTLGINAQSDASVSASLFGEVKLNFVSETLPLDRLADAARIALVQQASPLARAANPRAANAAAVAPPTGAPAAATPPPAAPVPAPPGSER